MEQRRLTRVQKIVLRYSEEGKTYLEMTQEVKYDPGHFKDIGFQLWRSLSKNLVQKVTD
ncbi:MAG: hypothetical protein ACYTXC_11915 [Nostoc sp.]